MYWLRRVAAEVRDILHWLNHNPPGGPPLRWRKPQRVFVDSMSDLFHEQLEVYDIAEVWARMAATEHITYQVLTKRAARLPEILNDRAFRDEVDRRMYVLDPQRGGLPLDRYTQAWPLSNVWLGVSVEDQATADERIPLLLQTPAAVRFVSYEPSLAGVDFEGPMNCPACEGDGENRNGNACTECHTTGERDRRWLSCRYHPGPVGSCRCAPTLDWIIVGGESGPNARPFDVEWARSTVRQCKAAGVPVFVKQLGAEPYDQYDGLGRVTDRKGGDPAEWPEDLRVREFPE